MNKEYRILGGMAGSSMDGLDLALVHFSKEEGQWCYRLERNETVAYPSSIYDSLKRSPGLAVVKEELDEHFGEWIASAVNIFLDESGADFLAIHGHTVTHRPEEGLSWQLGSGKRIAELTGIPCITNFRAFDIQLGGQGAPLVPFGDFELFSEFDACLNLGGIANLSIRPSRTAGDICPCNQVLNYYAGKLGYSFDKDGNLARKGHLDQAFWEKLEAIPYFRKSFPKSLPNAYISTELLDLVQPLDGLRTYVEFCADQIMKSLDSAVLNGPGRMLATGGGANNSFLLEVLQKKAGNWEVFVPSQEIVSFKEAIVFGFLGLKKVLGENNILSSVTGASRDSSSGVIHLPK